jgi:cation diffusion facilitator family transporter
VTTAAALPSTTSAKATASLEPTTAQLAQERTMRFVIIVDAFMVTALLLGGIVGGSLTMMAEAIRASLSYGLECFTIVVLRRIHRGVLADMEFGAGKLEQIASVVIAVSMLFGAAWIGWNVTRLWSGQRQLGAPIGLAYAAIVGMVNLYANVVAWDSVRRSMTADASIIMDAQLHLRWVKLVSSLVVSVGLTVSALSTDDVVVAWADSLGSLFVAIYMIVHAVGVLRSALPDLLDRSAGPRVRDAIMRALATHTSEYDRVLRLRSRRSGRTTFIEIHLAYDAALNMAEVQRRVEVFKNAIRLKLTDAEVSVVATCAVDADVVGSFINASDPATS